ncbi:hypothetical protein E0H73_30350 [Kribbella pittospori]|uniref:Uncharacterized protein n=1 Tax=Kribbella pittospori TaxID=722689 RepID=A0A4R0KGH5_9ACTN|nr:hypothetical protein [Kribbella pittospori]TCC57666.1 hypothetical protein E0H73_30350 [Kribbella pittospori]
MSSAVVVAGPSSMLGQVARKEIARYAVHPLFLVGAALVVLSSIGKPDGDISSLGNVIAPAAGFGVIGLLVMASLTRTSDQIASAAGAVVVSERTRTLGLVCALIVPFAAGLCWLGWAIWAYQHWPPPPNGAPFGGISDGWAVANLVALGLIPSIGGPVIGLVIGRWLPRRGAAPLLAVLLVAETIIMQGLFEPLRYIRLVAPWTYFTGPYGIPGDDMRIMILTGSPYWYCVYLLVLCALGVVLALLHDRERPRGPLFVVLGVMVAVAVVTAGLAITTGVQEVMINPLPSGQ